MLEPAKLELTKVQKKGTQVRVSTNEATIAEYVESIESGAQFPPIIVYFDGENYWIADGWHRFFAHERSGCITILAEVRKGGEQDALQCGLGANSTHGLPRNNADKRNVVEIALAHPEWSKLSTREIADLCAVSHNLVAEVRRGLSPADKAAQNNQARQTGENQFATKSAAIGTSMFPSPSAGYDPLLVGSHSASPSTALPQRSELEAKFTKAWRVAEQCVAQVLRSQGYAVEDRSRSNLGYDLYATKDNRVHYIEVKLLEHSGDPFAITSNEEIVARHHGESYTLALTLLGKGGVHIQFIHDPITKLPFERVCKQWVSECSNYEFTSNFFEVKAS